MSICNTITVFKYMIISHMHNLQEKVSTENRFTNLKFICEMRDQIRNLSIVNH